MISEEYLHGLAHSITDLRLEKILDEHMFLFHKRPDSISRLVKSIQRVPTEKYGRALYQLLQAIGSYHINPGREYLTAQFLENALLLDNDFRTKDGRPNIPKSLCNFYIGRLEAQRNGLYAWKHFQYALMDTTQPWRARILHHLAQSTLDLEFAKNAASLANQVYQSKRDKYADGGAHLLEETIASYHLVLRIIESTVPDHAQHPSYIFHQAKLRELESLYMNAAPQDR